MSSLVLYKSIRAGLADLAAMPGGPHLIPSRTQSLSPPGPMVLRLKAWESRSLPGLLDPCENQKVQRTLNHNVTASAVLNGRRKKRPFVLEELKLD